MARREMPMGGNVRFKFKPQKDSSRVIPVQAYVKPPKLKPPKRFPVDCVGPGDDEAEEAVFLPSGVWIVGFAKATTPPSQGSDAGGNLTIPVPAGVQSGDLLIATTSRQANSIATPAGWAPRSAFGCLLIYSRTAGASEPESYTWITSPVNAGRSGAIIAVRGGTLGNIAHAQFAGSSPPAVGCPNATAGIAAGALWLGFIGILDLGNDEDFSTSGIHTLVVQHAGGNSTGAEYPANAAAVAISAQADLLAGQVVGAGNLFSDVKENEAAASVQCITASIIINPA